MYSFTIFSFRPSRCYYVYLLLLHFTCENGISTNGVGNNSRNWQQQLSPLATLQIYINLALPILNFLSKPIQTRKYCRFVSTTFAQFETLQRLIEAYRIDYVSDMAGYYKPGAQGMKSWSAASKSVNRLLRCSYKSFCLVGNQSIKISRCIPTTNQITCGTCFRGAWYLGDEKSYHGQNIMSGP